MTGVYGVNQIEGLGAAHLADDDPAGPMAQCSLHKIANRHRRNGVSISVPLLPTSDEPEDIRMFVLYHDPSLTPQVPHSLGLTQGLIGVVYAFASPQMNGSNDVIIAHELLHTVGASDKYLPGSDAPRFPDGYGDPQQVPLYPQRTAEIMAGRRMLSATQWQQADGLDEVVLGPATALEIRWR